MTTNKKDSFSNVTKFQPREVRDFINSTPDFDVPDFVKTAALVGFTSFISYLAKELISRCPDDISNFK